MNVGKVLTVGQVIDSTERDWDSWCEELLDFSFREDESRDQNKIDGYCYAWKDCFSFLKRNMTTAPEVRSLPLLFEYMPPLRNGRRTDVIILMDYKVVVLEFKATAQYNENEMIQTNGYVHYVETSHDVSLRKHMTVEGYLVRTKDHGENRNCEIGTVLDADNFAATIMNSVSGHNPYPDVDEWTNSETTTIPSIMDAVHIIYESGATKEIQYLKDGDLGASLPFINATIDSVQQSGGKAVIIVDGVPGSGKTYLGTQVAFDRKTATPPAVYTSGNDPLINYMQTILSPEGSTNIQDDCPFVVGIRNIKKTYVYDQARPKFGVIVFDESQRAWDENKMGRGYSEVEGLLQLGDRTHAEFGSCVLMCLFGIGQAIHEGEEKGLELWDEAIANHQDWHYYVSSNVKSKLNVTGNISEHEELHLSTAIRNNYIDLSEWIDAVVDNKPVNECRELLNDAKRKGFQLRIVRHLDYWKKYMKQYQPDYNRGVLVSSFVSKNDLKLASRNTIFESYMDAWTAGRWFTGGSNEMSTAASEFVCQGLELDWPFVLFGGDFYRKDNSWEMVIPDNKRSLFEDPEEILRNIYRILLSRGREGMFLVIPDGERFEETYSYFKEMGVQSIKET